MAAQTMLETELDWLGTSLVVVQGDTMSALAGARAGVSLEVPVVHVEAGVRSGCPDEPWPEEGYRREITRLASWHYAATTTAFANLLVEGVSERFVRLTGNPVVSALARYTPAKPRAPEAYIVVTMHRREWLARGRAQEFYQDLCQACAEHPALTVHWLLHPHTAQHVVLHDAPSNLCIGQPLPYAAMASLLSYACGILTDSGGLVEEAATLGVPSAIMRRCNDRPEAVEEGVARQFLPEDVKETVECLATGQLPRRQTDVYGTPEAASKIARHLASLVENA